MYYYYIYNIFARYLYKILHAHAQTSGADPARNAFQAVGGRAQHLCSSRWTDGCQAIGTH